MSRRNAQQHQTNSVASDILEALAEFTDALEKGEVRKRYVIRRMQLDIPPKRYDAQLVKRTRKLLGASQAFFARLLGVSPKTVRAWERGDRSPQPVACRFMDEIRRDPNYWIRRMTEAVHA